MNVMETIGQRISVRTFLETPINSDQVQMLEQACEAFTKGPFGNTSRFLLLNLGHLNQGELRSLGTYGFIKGARFFILGATGQNDKSLEDYGYCLEKIILKATALGLGTCWLGGTFKRSSFASHMNLSEGDILPAITPVGLPADSVSKTDQAVRYAASSQKRKPWSELFFQSDGKQVLTESDAGPYRNVLEAVRIGPSASNRQPWRIVRESNNCFHLYLNENKVYNQVLGKIRLQNVDMGIAMSHFELVARENGLPGKWSANSAIENIGSLEYIATWSR